MRKTVTETSHEQAAGLDLKQPEAILALLMDGQTEAAASVRPAADAIASASRITARTIRSGGTLAYAAAGSSGLMAMSDALELPGTFGIDRKQISILFAGGPPWLDTFRGGPEDDYELGVRDVDKSNLGDNDCMIAVSASGSTPYALGAMTHAHERGTATIGIANNAGSPLLEMAGTPILLPTPPELIAGSTRMGAGTAQKIALNLMSTLMAIELGHVVDGHMVNLSIENAKLRSRALNMISDIAGCTDDTASHCLEQSDGSVKIAILLACGAANMDAARHLLNTHNGNVRSARAALDQGQGPEKQRA
ncbi:N-acetylmuramic acid 6-phosphate etherase [Hoeflea poritis]|uniref:N-acetylmuramic acid 6-phosphate etherase n=1 Tax=Hoeflea poritis TaxID=2993659 RepID=A0ABT4VIS8_9HYPH|nr:N-acetylmuramic acid 6-phosphate etherase [Hoeflea poritis]MDA4844570.1 N-acetylmuramic acid 6-phosphate etherase [Hoeflea poritis]